MGEDMDTGLENRRPASDAEGGGEPARRPAEPSGSARARPRYAGSGRAEAGPPAEVALVDDDPDFADSLGELLRLHGCNAHAYATAAAFMADAAIERLDVVLLDIFMPGIDGLSAQRQLAARDLDVPIIVVTGSSDVAHAVSAMKQGAVDYLVKPFEPEALLEKVRSAAAEGRERRRARSLRRELTTAIEELTPREREVLERLIGGQSSKMIARELDMSPRTVDTHRTRILRKFEVETTLMLINRFSDSRFDSGNLRG
jgi:RNA polymerase sigma factor (sigma-70 family)